MRKERDLKMKKREMKMRWTIIGTNLSLMPFLSFL